MIFVWLVERSHLNEPRALPTIQTGLAIRNFVGPIPRSISFNVWYVLYSEYVRVGIPVVTHHYPL